MCSSADGWSGCSIRMYTPLSGAVQNASVLQAMSTRTTRPSFPHSRPGPAQFQNPGSRPYSWSGQVGGLLPSNSVMQYVLSLPSCNRRDLRYPSSLMSHKRTPICVLLQLRLGRYSLPVQRHIATSLICLNRYVSSTWDFGSRYSTSSILASAPWWPGRLPSDLRGSLRSRN